MLKMEVQDNKDFKDKVVVTLDNTSEAGTETSGCGWKHFRFKQIRIEMWAKIVAWFDIIFGTFCTVILIYDIIVAVQEAGIKVSSNFQIGFLEPEENLKGSSLNNGTKLYIIASLLSKVIYLLSYCVKVTMGIFLLQAIRKENPTHLKRWMIATILCLAHQLFLVTPLLIIAKKFDYIAYCLWEVPVWILTTTSLLIVHSYREDLQHFHIPVAVKPPLEEIQIQNEKPTLELYEVKLHEPNSSIKCKIQRYFSRRM